ncbi:DUF6193 family natural product biosynthesis protein [Streptomyces venezuelae]|uniref:DUF6193 family natural product biosynthesis protein n=1 Tax=Streptomyces venezuelae TaxID=54571 RepID=UPI0033218715
MGTGDYTIREWWNGPALHHATTAAEAIAIAVDRIPADLLQPSSENPALRVTPAIQEEERSGRADC